MDNDIDMGDALVDEVLAEDFLESDVYAEDAYDRWRDDQCDALFDDLQALVDKHVHPKKHGYFKESPARFLEHAVTHLKYFTGCDLTAFEDKITAVKREPKSIEYVEGGGKHEKLSTTPRA